MMKRLIPATMNAMMAPTKRMRKTPSSSLVVYAREDSSRNLPISERPTESTHSAVGYFQLHAEQNAQNTEEDIKWNSCPPLFV